MSDYRFRRTWWGRKLVLQHRSVQRVPTEDAAFTFAVETWRDVRVTGMAGAVRDLSLPPNARLRDAGRRLVLQIRERQPYFGGGWVDFHFVWRDAVVADLTAFFKEISCSTSTKPLPSSI